MRALRPALLLAVSVASFACGETPAAKNAQTASAAQAAAPTTTAATTVPRTTSLKRSQVKQTIGKGLGYFLQNVTVEDYPAMKANKFYGWKVRSVNADLGVDVRQGDVVTRVNGMPIERPEQADAAMRSLEKAPALRVEFERDGKPQTLELPITEE
jgi:type II secretory pathway component PulC